MGLTILLQAKSSVPPQQPRTRAFVAKHRLVVPELFKADGRTSGERLQRPIQQEERERPRTRCAATAGASKPSGNEKYLDERTSVNRAASATGKSVKKQKTKKPRQSHEPTENFGDGINAEV